MSTSTSLSTILSYAAPANSWLVGTTYRFEGLCQVNRTGALTATSLYISLELNGTEYANTTTAIFQSVGAGGVHVIAYVTCYTLGIGGEFVANLLAHGDMAQIAGATPTASETYNLLRTDHNFVKHATTRDTGGIITMSIKSRLTVAVAGVTVYWPHAFWHRISG